MSLKTVRCLVRKLGMEGGLLAMLAVKKCDCFSKSQWISLFVFKMLLHPAVLRVLHGCVVQEIRTQESPKSPLLSLPCPLRLRSGIVWKWIWMTAQNIWLLVIWGSTNAATRPAPLRAVNTWGLREIPKLLWPHPHHAAALSQRLRGLQGGAQGDTSGLCPTRASRRNWKMVRTNSWIN